MPSDCISYQDSGYFSALIVDYLNQKPELKPLYNRFPSIENFGPQIEQKRQNFPFKNREILVNALKAQYQHAEVSERTQANIELLANETAFTVTTGHQINLFTGPLYFLYKIVSAINLAKELSQKYPEKQFVPVYWMATEDHDFEEISYFNFRGKKFRWNRESSGAVGRLRTQELETVLKHFTAELGIGDNAGKMAKLFKDAYLGHDNLADATRFLANSLFGQYGLVIVDGDDKNLKRLFAPYVKQELVHRTSFEKVTETIRDFGNYNVQVNPREINLFFLADGIRERIVYENGKYVVNGTSISFSELEILAEADANPQNFSPNVITRPLYQEVILPNLCYIGGGGEIAYWLELHAFFKAVDVAFPVLMLRNSALLANAKQAKKADALGLSWKDLFAPQQELVNKKINEISEFPLNLMPQKLALQKQFTDLYALAERTDKSFAGAVKAQEAKQLKGLENLEKRLLKAQKRKHSEELNRILSLQDELFPLQGLQERQANFSEFYVEIGDNLIPMLLGKLQPLNETFEVIVF